MIRRVVLPAFPHKGELEPYPVVGRGGCHGDFSSAQVESTDDPVQGVFVLIDIGIVLDVAIVVVLELVLLRFGNLSRWRREVRSECSR